MKGIAELCPSNYHVTHRLSDELSLTLGTNILGGSSPTTFFGQLSHTDNLYFAARHDF